MQTNKDESIIFMWGKQNPIIGRDMFSVCDDNNLRKWDRKFILII